MFDSLGRLADSYKKVPEIGSDVQKRKYLHNILRLEKLCTDICRHCILSILWTETRLT